MIEFINKSGLIDSNDKFKPLSERKKRNLEQIYKLLSDYKATFVYRGQKKKNL